MGAGGFFRLTAPDAWPSPPPRFSFSSLSEIERCPRRWQYLHATWEGKIGLPRRASERAIVGVIAHGINERLFRGMAERGLPAVGTTGYLEALRTVGVHDAVRTMIADAEAAYREHPRDEGFRLRATARDVANEALRLFQAQYARVVRRPGAPAEPCAEGGGGHDLLAMLRRRGVLAEVSVRHGRLPVMGQIDLVVEGAGGTAIVDFKTGEVKAEYRDQLQLYAMLWWRQTGDAPVQLEIVHVQGREVWPVTQDELAVTERATAARIAEAVEALGDGPARARPGEECRHCPARAFCSDYWSSGRVQGAALVGEEAWVDLEVTIEGQASATGLTGRNARGELVDVVFEDEAVRRWGPFAVDERVRILGARTGEGGEVRLSRSSEVFRL